jgi:O-methyltransferase involved in polyketide biosynthesis
VRPGPGQPPGPAHPGRPRAEELVRKLGYDCGRFRLSASPIINIALRAKKLDQVARRFIDQHPNAVGLDLGAGLDTRGLCCIGCDRV